MRSTMIFILWLALAGSATAATIKADDITGVWRTKSGGYVQIFRNGKRFDGIVVGSVDGKPRYDTKNPDPNKRGRRLLGVTILHSLHYEGGKDFGGGHIYDPANGKVYKAKATLVGPDTLNARGYIGLSLFGKTQTWHRIAPNAPHVHQSLMHHPVGAAPHSGN